MGAALALLAATPALAAGPSPTPSLSPSPSATTRSSPSPSPRPSATPVPVPAATAAATPAPPPTPSPVARPATAQPGHLVARVPIRLLDTRDGTGGHYGALGPGQSVDIQVAGVAGVPLTATTAVVNLTATQPTASGFLTAYPSGQAWPLSSSLNFGAGATVPNLVTVGIGAGGKISVINASGSTHVIVDLEGWYEPGTGGTGLYRAISPDRIIDSRDGTGGVTSRLGPGQSVDVHVEGMGNVPATGVAAVALNLTGVAPSSDGYLSVRPLGNPVPVASNVNLAAGRTSSNRVIAFLNSGGFSIYNCCGTVDIVVDVNGWFTDASNSVSGGEFTPVNPARILDTRDGTGGTPGPIGPAVSFELIVAGHGGVPASGAGAAVLNLTETASTSGGFATSYSTDNWPPNASDLNFVAGETRANQVLVRLGADGGIRIVNASGSAQYIVDVVGWYATQPSLGALPGAPGTVSATSGVQSATVSWQAASPGGSHITSYTVMSSPNVGYALLGPNATSAVFTGLRPDTTYTFSVAATNAAGTGPATASNAVQPTPPSSYLVPNVPLYHQQQSLTCEAASLRMVLAHEGITAAESDIMANIGDDPRAPYWDSTGMRWGNPFSTFVGNPNGSEINLTGYGTYYPTIARVAALYGGTVVRSGTGIGASDVYNAVLSGDPVITWVTYDWGTPARHDYLSFDGTWIPYAGPDEHAVVVIGVTSTSILVNDPIRGQYWTSKATFEGAYGVYGHMAVVMT